MRVVGSVPIGLRIAVETEEGERLSYKYYHDKLFLHNE